MYYLNCRAYLKFVRKYLLCDVTACFTHNHLSYFCSHVCRDRPSCMFGMIIHAIVYQHPTTGDSTRSWLSEYARNTQRTDGHSGVRLAAGFPEITRPCEDDSEQSPTNKRGSPSSIPACEGNRQRLQQTLQTLCESPVTHTTAADSVCPAYSPINRSRTARTRCLPGRRQQSTHCSP